MNHNKMRRPQKDERSLRLGAGRATHPPRGRGWKALAVTLVAAAFLMGSLTPAAGAASLSLETSRGFTRLSDTTRAHEDGLAVTFDVPLETQEVVTALSLAPGTEFRLTYEASQIPQDRDPSQPGSDLLRAEAWYGLPSWPLALGLMHQSISWQWATGGADEQIPFAASGWGVGLETRLALTPNLVAGAELRATPWAHWTDEESEATDPHRLFFLGYDVDARYFLSPNTALQVGYRWDTLRAVAYRGLLARDVARSGLYMGLSLGF